MTSDSALVALILAGNPEGARLLVQRYGQSLRRLLLHTGATLEEIDDVLQESWIRVIKNAHRYDPTQPFSRWLFTIAMNRLRTQAGRRRATEATDAPLEDHSESLVNADASAHDTLERGEAAAIIRHRVALQPPHLADAILLRYFEELSEKEIALATGVPLGTVKSRLHTAVKRLHLELERIFNV